MYKKRLYYELKKLHETTILRDKFQCFISHLKIDIMILKEHVKKLAKISLCKYHR